MKKLALVCFLLFAISGISQSQTITVTSPNGGENWALGSTHAITWTSSGLTGEVNIFLFNGDQRVGVIQSNVPVTAGSFSWVVGNYQGGTAAPGTNYKVRVRKPQTEILDSSDRPFTISGAAPSASLSVTSPNGGETWQTNVAHEVRWTSSGISGNVTIKLKKSDAVVKSWTAENTGSSYWLCLGVQAENDYKIRVENSTGSVFDESDRAFTIQVPRGPSPPPLVGSIRVEAPNGGETWRRGFAHNITWKAQNISGNVSLILLKGNEEVGIVAENLSPQVGSFSWVAGKYHAGTAPAGNDYYILITANNGNLEDKSDGPFSITDLMKVEAMEGVIRIPPRITSFGLNNGAEIVDDLLVTFNYQCMGGATHYRYRINPAWEDWQPLVSGRQPYGYLLISGCEQTVYFQVKNEYGESNVVSDSIKTSTYRTTRTIGISEAMRYARPQGFTCGVIKTDCGDCAGIIEFPNEGYQFELGYPFDPPKNLTGGMKADYELFGGGKLLKPGWEFVSFGMPEIVQVGNPDLPDAQGKRILYQPPAGGRDIKLQVHLWRNILSGAVIFYVRTITLKGPCTEDISEAFKQ